MKVELSKREAKVTRDVLATVLAYTEAEMADQFDWTEADIEARSTALTKFTAVTA